MLELVSEVRAWRRNRATRKARATSQHEHVPQRRDHGKLLHTSLAARQGQQRAQIASETSRCCGQLSGEFLMQFLQFFLRHFRGFQVPRNLPVEIAADDAADRNRKHDPERHPAKPPNLNEEWKAITNGAAIPRITW